MRVAVLSSESPESVYARVRLVDLMDFLRPTISYSWTRTDQEFLNSDEPAFALRQADIIVVQRSFPSLRTASLLQDLMFASDKPVVYETDDLLTGLPKSHPSFAGLEKHRHLVLGCIANSDAVITSTTALKAQYEHLNPKIYVVENSLDRGLWYMNLPTTVRSCQTRVLNIGFCGSSTHVDDLTCVEHALERIQERYGPRVRFTFFGCITDRLRKLPDVTYQEGFRNYSEYPELLRSLNIDIGLAPLEDTLFNLCKSNIKYLEYAACAIPGVYSDVGPYRGTVTQKQTGLLVDNSTDAWYAAISKLIEDRAFASEVAMAAHRDVWSRFSVPTIAQNWLNVMVRVMKTHLDERTDGMNPRSGLTQVIWEHAVASEKRVAQVESAMENVLNKLAWLENRQLLRAVRAIKGAFRRGRNAG